MLEKPFNPNDQTHTTWKSPQYYHGEPPKKEAEHFFESGKFYDERYVVEHTHLPENHNDIPHMIYLAGPARGGTTAFGFLMASQPDVDRSYFQPHKNVIRHGNDFIVEPARLVVAKETFGPVYDAELFDPIELLIKSGYPPEKLTAIISLRHPIPSVASLDKLVTGGVDPNYYEKMQRHTIELHKKYTGILGNRAIPFTFDLLGMEVGVDTVLEKLTQRIGLGLDRQPLKREWNMQILRDKMVWGEADPEAHPQYYAEAVAPTLNRGRFDYVSNTLNKKEVLSSEKMADVQRRCEDEYFAFQELAARDLKLLQ